MTFLHIHEDLVRFYVILGWVLLDFGASGLARPVFTVSPGAISRNLTGVCSQDCGTSTVEVFVSAARSGERWTRAAATPRHRS